MEDRKVGWFGADGKVFFLYAHKKSRLERLKEWALTAAAMTPAGKSLLIVSFLIGFTVGLAVGL